MCNFERVKEDWMKRIEEDGHQFFPDPMESGCFYMCIVDYGVGPGMCGAEPR